MNIALYVKWDNLADEQLPFSFGCGHNNYSIVILSKGTATGNFHVRIYYNNGVNYII
jgi:hypothetical protein